MCLTNLRAELASLSNPAHALVSKRFFKTGPGQYGQGDQFIGIRAPDLRNLSKKHQNLSLGDIDRLLHSPVHEERMLALLLLIQRYRTGDEVEKQAVYDLYLARTRFINNWDLVDVSAEHIVGQHLSDRDKAPLRLLSVSEDLWERRIAIIATFCFIKQGRFDETLEISRILLNDPHELIHKAVGWMLREVGKRNRDVEETFLRSHTTAMPRTMLRYAIEKFPEPLRQAYLKGTI